MTDTEPTPTYAARRTVDYLPSTQGDGLRKLVQRGEYAHGFLPELLREDCREVLPYKSGNRGGFTAVIASDDQIHATELITAALAQRPGERALAGTLREFFSATADTLLRHERAHYEIVYARVPGHDDEPAAGFRLLRVPPGTVRSRRGRTVQYVPAPLAARHARDDVGFIDLDPSTLAVFELDQGLRRQLKAAAAALAAADAFTGASSPDARRGAETSANGRATAPSVTAATAPIGWNGRIEPLSKAQLTPYIAWRRLHCLAFKIKIREAILAALNAALADAGRQLHLPMMVELPGLVTLDQVQTAEQDLREGRRSLGELTVWALQ